MKVKRTSRKRELDVVLILDVKYPKVKNPFDPKYGVRQTDDDPMQLYRVVVEQGEPLRIYDIGQGVRLATAEEADAVLFRVREIVRSRIL